MRFSALSCCVVIALATAAASLAGCDEVAKAIDANNSQPGEADGRAVELAKIPQRLASLAFDDTELWVVAENGDILKRPRDGSAAPTKVGSFARAELGGTARALLDAEFLYILDGQSVSRMPRAGGAVEKLANAAPSNLAQSADALFAVSVDTKTLVRIDKKTKATTDLATGFLVIEDIVAEGDRIIVVDRDAETLTSVTMKDGTKTELAKNQSRPYRVGLGPGYVYWINGALSDANKAVEDRILRVKLDGSGQPETVVAKSTEFPSRIVGDAQFLYIGQYCGGLYRVPVAGGESTKFVNAAVQDFDLTTDRVFLMEDNGCRFDATAKAQPNRLLSITK
jgi:hypothetical protein